MEKIAVYTAITGSYDDLKPVLCIEPSFDYICFTDYDFKGKIPAPWLHIRLPKSSLVNKDVARYCKLNPHKLLPMYTSSVWIDGNISIKSEISNLVIGVLTSSDVASYQHWGRDATEQEFYECARCGFDYAWQLKAQLQRYYDDGYSSADFFENNVIFRNHMKPSLIMMHDIWWLEYLKGGKRDQYSFTYAAYKAGVIIKSLGMHDPRIKKMFFDYSQHAKNRPLKQTIIKIVNRLYIMATRWRVSESKRENALAKK
ncbi:DUF616 domain-containing protein [Klebsiella grimontii]|uniref:glycosyltransferase domain-containing protein n=1 Tax=Klebsiella TaxID=570 RepID=UPI000E35372E|nr:MULTISPECIES: glycosyltransferase domain-containing protein [Klebsiella]RFP40796.1 hypothetical protein DDJ34_23195 [Klebsiella oxytoca]MDK7031538.1 DUF616 domain-containing protein [Klebsiella grimontii]MDM4402603.1 DUF616 domain-containing protein [Klebsiella grimontii]QTP41869.1 DUF616 domain-containing protein [Klebsiella grimontii]RFP46972.1 hypothetical protein DDJ69_23250 [Klebsiella oxytoca]